MNLDIEFTAFTQKINSQKIVILNIKSKTIKLLKDKRENLAADGFGDNFLNENKSKIMTLEIKNCQVGFIKIKHMYSKTPLGL